jgi:hypothetical protein
VRLSAAGERAAERVRARELALAEGVLARLGPRRAAEVLDALSELLGAVRDETESCCPGAFDHLMEALPAAGEGERRSRECCEAR